MSAFKDILIKSCLYAAAIALMSCSEEEQRAVTPPEVFAAPAENLLAMRNRINDAELETFKSRLVLAADTALSDEVYSVTDKPNTVEGAGAHDYVSLAPYWWPDPSQPDGLPYIRHDGVVNPERDEFDVKPFEKTIDNITALSLAFYFTREERYAARAALLVRVWFLDEETKMNPHLEFAQVVKGRESELRPYGIVEGNRLRYVADVNGLLEGSASWTAEDNAQLKNWVRDYVFWLETSENGEAESRQPNNHSTWYAVQISTLALYCGEYDVAAKWIAHGKTLIESQIDPDGSQPNEISRTKSWDYSVYNVMAFIQLASLAPHVDENLWDYQTADAQSIRGAVDYLVSFVASGDAWPYTQIEDIDLTKLFVITAIAAKAWNDEPHYTLSELRDDSKLKLYDFLFVQ